MIGYNWTILLRYCMYEVEIEVVVMTVLYCRSEAIWGNWDHRRKCPETYRALKVSSDRSGLRTDNIFSLSGLPRHGG